MKRRLMLLTALLGVLLGAPAIAQEADEEDSLKPTEIGVRFTPEIAGAMSRKFVNEMKPRYGLDDKQAEEITDVMQRQFMKFARSNSTLGRDMIELMMATAIENDGMFPKVEAMKFGGMATQFTSKLKDFFTEAAGEIGKQMTVKQRLQFTGDVGLASAGLLTFENRMKKWEEGKVSGRANPFFDMPEDKGEEGKEAEPVDPNESPAHRKARKDVERSSRWTMERDQNWSKYLDQAAKFYGFSETQLTSGKAILKDCQERAKAIKTPTWRVAVKEIHIAQQLSYGAGEQISQGPWMRSLDEALKKLNQPMLDLEDEFKRRVDSLADSTQRAMSRESVRKAFAEKGVKQLPI